MISSCLWILCWLLSILCFDISNFLLHTPSYIFWVTYFHFVFPALAWHWWGASDVVIFSFCIGIGNFWGTATLDNFFPQSLLTFPKNLLNLLNFISFSLFVPILLSSPLSFPSFISSYHTMVIFIQTVFLFLSCWLGINQSLHRLFSAFWMCICVSKTYQHHILPCYKKKSVAPD